MVTWLTQSIPTLWFKSQSSALLSISIPCREGLTQLRNTSRWMTLNRSSLKSRDVSALSSLHRFRRKTSKSWSMALKALRSLSRSQECLSTREASLLWVLLKKGKWIWRILDQLWNPFLTRLWLCLRLILTTLTITWSITTCNSHLPTFNSQ
jgi:hypothetical protein